MRSLFTISLSFSAIVVGFLVSGAVAYDEERAKNNFASELVECSAYFNIGSEGIRRTGKLEAAAQAEANSKVALDAARQYSKDEVVLARFKLALEAQANLIGHDYANLSLLITKYGDICKRALENPGDRLQYWSDKE